MVNTEQLLKRFKIRVNHYVITNDNGIAIKFIVSGGAEVIDEAHTIETIKEMIIEHGAGRDTTKIIDGQRLPFKYTTTPFSFNKLEELAKYKSIKSLSKEEALNINKDIKLKSELEDKLVYITDKEPSTNSLALAKQFNLEHYNVILKLFELGSMYPSILMKIKYDAYSDKALNSGTEDSIEYSILSKNSLALAKQFDLKHFQVVEKILELGAIYPSVLMKIKYDVYSDEVDASSGRPSYGSLNHIEDSIRVKYDTINR